MFSAWYSVYQRQRVNKDPDLHKQITNCLKSIVLKKCNRLKHFATGCNSQLYNLHVMPRMNFSLILSSSSALSCLSVCLPSTHFGLSLILSPSVSLFLNLLIHSFYCAMCGLNKSFQYNSDGHYLKFLFELKYIYTQTGEACEEKIADVMVDMGHHTIIQLAFGCFGVWSIEFT